MKIVSGFVFAFVVAIFTSCTGKTQEDASKQPMVPIAGTWKLIRGTVISNNDTVVTDYTTNTSFVKIINDTHFAFLQHDLKKGKDSVPVFVSGGGPYSLSGNAYTEHLEYCTDRNWEGSDFTFTIGIRNDTLTQSGVEKVESAGVNRTNTEQYIRVKK